MSRTADLKTLFMIIFGLYFIGSIGFLLFAMIAQPLVLIPSNEARMALLENLDMSFTFASSLPFMFGLGIAYFMFPRKGSILIYANHPVNGGRVFLSAIQGTLLVSLPISLIYLGFATIRMHSLLNAEDTIIFSSLLSLELFALSVLMASVSTILMLEVAKLRRNSIWHSLLLTAVIIVALGPIQLSLRHVGLPGVVAFGNSIYSLLLSSAEDLLDALMFGYILPRYVGIFIIIMSLMILVVMVGVIRTDALLESARIGERQTDKVKSSLVVKSQSSRVGPFYDVLRVMLMDYRTLGQPMIEIILIGTLVLAGTHYLSGSLMDYDILMLGLISLAILVPQEVTFISTIAGRNTRRLFFEAPNGTRYYFILQVVCSSLIALLVTFAGSIFTHLILSIMPTLELMSRLSTVMISVIVAFCALGVAATALWPPVSMEDPRIIPIIGFVFLFGIPLGAWLFMADLQVKIAMTIIICAFSFVILEVRNN